MANTPEQIEQIQAKAQALVDDVLERQRQLEVSLATLGLDAQWAATTIANASADDLAEVQRRLLEANLPADLIEEAIAPAIPSFSRALRARLKSHI